MGPEHMKTDYKTLLETTAAAAAKKVKHVDNFRKRHNFSQFSSQLVYVFIFLLCHLIIYYIKLVYISFNC